MDVPVLYVCTRCSAARIITRRAPSPLNLACTLHTPGSTAVPRCVLVHHDGLVQRAQKAMLPCAKERGDGGILYSQYSYTRPAFWHNCFWSLCFYGEKMLLSEQISSYYRVAGKRALRISEEAAMLAEALLPDTIARGRTKLAKFCRE